jgi:hypothetical protein
VTAPLFDPEGHEAHMERIVAECEGHLDTLRRINADIAEMSRQFRAKHFGQADPPSDQPPTD